MSGDASSSHENYRQSWFIYTQLALISLIADLIAWDGDVNAICYEKLHFFVCSFLNKLFPNQSSILNRAPLLPKLSHDDVIKYKHFPLYWPFVRGIHRSPVNSPHKGQWRGALIFSLIGGWMNDWVNNREAGDLRRYRAHYDVSVMVGPDQNGCHLTDDIAWMKIISTIWYSVGDMFKTIFLRNVRNMNQISH